MLLQCFYDTFTMLLHYSYIIISYLFCFDGTVNWHGVTDSVQYIVVVCEILAEDAAVEGPPAIGPSLQLSMCFDFEIGPRGARVPETLPTKFGIRRPFRFPSRWRHRTDRQTDRQDLHMMGPPSRKDGPIISNLIDFVMALTYWIVVLNCYISAKLCVLRWPCCCHR